ncbi:MAG: efflux RND transporter periplasmic adaptor subunit [Candidatus Omnitrophica bacterium]|jgi:multidrug efflux pump subunit AcrA (membrane-fusion protein)|nr:efflux RND transporter periplasmic adaptor subunit [Candidatus Omnitrophota bacterium]MDD3987337.1 efflux RND transporter periplasmic adaptor subunit [Candidatus Omnitrophota bacterium]MDD4981618.1 efflux RND transporter periplasmic adaptor subunit [Candidatus Omnitrophota bacterium]MDD5665075.1 efflux RND transporter periplasmic adaptor subunit [Candidatus Omnitrophota bacterium]
MRKFILILFLYSAFICGCQAKEINNMKQEVIPVKAMKLEAKELNYILEYAGDIKATDEAYIYPKVSGKIIEKVKEDGSLINKGDVICYIDRDEVGLKFEKAPVESTLTGVVGRVFVDIGENVNTQTPVAFVVNDEKVKITLDIPEKYMPRISLSQEAKAKVDSWPNEEFPGVVTKISPVIDLSTRSAPIEITVDNPEGRLRSGMFAKVSIILDKRLAALAILKEATMGRDSNTYVFVIENKKAALRQISLGIKDGPYYEVLSGLREGELVVIMGQQKLYEGALVEAEVDNP